MEKKKERSNHPFPFLEFKNPETNKEIYKIISQNEGILIENIDKYLTIAHAKRKGALLIEVKTLLKDWWRKKTGTLALSDFAGLVDLALFEIKVEIEQVGELYKKKMIEEIKRKKG